MPLSTIRSGTRGLPGYFFCVGNHIPWNVPAEAVKHYFEAAEGFGKRV